MGWESNLFRCHRGSSPYFPNGICLGPWYIPLARFPCEFETLYVLKSDTRRGVTLRKVHPPRGPDFYFPYVEKRGGGNKLLILGLGGLFILPMMTFAFVYAV